MNSVVLTLCEILENLNSSGLLHYDMMPIWMEQSLASLVQVYGIRKVAAFVLENNLQEHAVLKRTVQLFHFQQLDGCSTQS